MSLAACLPELGEVYVKTVVVGGVPLGPDAETSCPGPWETSHLAGEDDKHSGTVSVTSCELI